MLPLYYPLVTCLLAAFTFIAVTYAVRHNGKGIFWAVILGIMLGMILGSMHGQIQYNIKVIRLQTPTSHHAY